MQVQVYNAVDALPEATVQAFSYRNGQPFFTSHEWFGCLAQHGTDAVMKPRIYVASHESTPVCALYCATTRAGRLLSLTSFYSMYYAPVVTTATADEALAAIVSRWAEERWSTVDLQLMRDGDPIRDTLEYQFQRHGFRTFSYPQHDNWYLDVQGRSFDDYFRQLSSRLRNTIRRKGNKLHREHQVELAIYPRDAVSLEESLSNYETVYQGSWKQAEPFPDFMPALFRLCDQLGIVRVGTARIDNEPAAAQIWINDHGRTLIYKLAYDDKYAPHSIGSVLSRALFEFAIDDDQVTEIDYGVGNEPYKRDWMSDVRQLNGLLACNSKSLGGRLAAWRQQLSEMRRRWQAGQEQEQ